MGLKVLLLILFISGVNLAQTSTELDWIKERTSIPEINSIHNRVINTYSSDFVKNWALQNGVSYIMPDSLDSSRSYIGWISNGLPQYIGDFNEGAIKTIGSENLKLSPYQLDGNGIKIIQWESAKSFAHPDYAHRLTWGEPHIMQLSGEHWLDWTPLAFTLSIWQEQ